MSNITNKLNHLSETKSLIKTAIENKGVTIEPNTPFKNYADKIGEITLSVGNPSKPSPIVNNVWSEEYYQSVLNSVTDEYERPSDWLPIDHLVTAGEQKIVMLVAIGSIYGDTLSFRVTGAVRINWGNGVETTHNTSTNIQRILNYDDYPGTECSRGYRQAVITITSSSGNLTLFRFETSITNLSSSYSHPVLEIIMSGQNFTQVQLGASSGYGHPDYLERFVYLGTAPVLSNLTNCFNRARKLKRIILPASLPALTNLSNTFQDCFSLVKSPAINAPLLNTTANMFNGCHSLKVVSPITTSNVTTMANMFEDCYNLITIPSMDTAKVTTMASFLYDASSLIAVPPLNVINCTIMSSAFRYCSLLEKIDLLNTSKIENCSYLFAFCTKLTSLPDLDFRRVNSIGYFLSGTLDVVTNITFSFQNGTLDNLGGVTNTLGDNKILKVVVKDCTFTGTVYFKNFFSGMRTIREVVLENITGTATIDASSMFNGCRYLHKITITNCPALSTCNSMFANCSALEEVDIELPGATIIDSIFSSCTKLKKARIIAPFVTSASVIVDGCRSLEELTLDLRRVTIFNVGSLVSQLVKVTFIGGTNLLNNAFNMFSGCHNLKEVIGLNTSNSVNFNSAFANCYSLEKSPLIDASSATTTSLMFVRCCSLKEVNIINTMNVTNMSFMFSGCFVLENFPIMDTSKVTNMSSMFQETLSMQAAPFYNTSSVVNVTNMFSGSSVTFLPLYDFSKVTSGGGFVNNNTRNLTEIPAYDFQASTDSSVISLGCPMLSKLSARGIKNTFSLNNSRLSASALVEVFNNLPVVTGKTITITNNWGASLLTSPERAIATSKGWSISG